MSAFGTLLKETRQTLHLSQLDLAVEANVSSKHISFLETGRANPSKEMVLHIARVCNIGLARTNRLLSAAGYNQIFSQQNLNSPEMKMVKDAVDHLLQAHNPYPAMLLDKDFNLINFNTAQMHLMQQLILHGAKVDTNTNLFLAFFDEEGLKPFLEDWEDLACHMLQRLHHDHLAGPYRDQPNHILEQALQLPSVPPHWQTAHIDNLDKPVLGFTLNLGNTRLKMFSTISTFGTPMDITAQNLRVEHFFPEDEFTKEYWKSRIN